MPKIVDQEERRLEFARAATRLAARGGFEAVSMRKVAAEAGLSYGSLFHYFDSRDDLLLFTIEQMTAEQGRRVNDYSSRFSGLRALEQMICDDAIVSDTSRDEWMVWQAFLYRSALQDRFAEMHARLISEWVQRFVDLLSEARDAGEIDPDLDVEHEALALWVYSAGLGQQALLHSKQLPQSRQKRLIASYLDKLRA